MNWIDRQLIKLFPSHAGKVLQRQIALQRLKRMNSLLGSGEKSRRSFEAISGNRLRYDMPSTGKSADSFTGNSLEALRNNVRWLEYNNGHVGGVIKRIRNNVVGRGIKLQAKVKEDEGKQFTAAFISEQLAVLVNMQAEEGFSRFNREADKRMISTFYELQGQACAALERDGEVLVIGRESARANRQIPYCQEVLEADRLQTPLSEINNPRIRNGIVFDDEGAPKAYLVLKIHPGETIMPGLLGKDDSFEEIPAFYSNGNRKVLHLFDPVRPEQTRGYSGFAGGLKDLQDADRYREAVIMAFMENACLTGFVTSKNPEGWQNGSTVASGSDEEGYNRLHEFAPNTFHYLNPDEDIKLHTPDLPTNELDGFIRLMLEGPANAKDVPPEVLTQNWKGFNYSNARTVLLQFFLSCTIRQQYLIDHLCIPTYENVFQWMVIKGIVRAPGFDRRKSAYMRHSWIPPGWQWVDPVKEATGKKIEDEQGYDDPYSIAASKGRDADEVLEAKARFLRRKKELEEKYGIKFQAEELGVVDSSKEDEGE